jgi:hypothetical protein
VSKNKQTTQTVDSLTRSAANTVWNKAKEVANKPYEAYTGQLVAPLTPEQQRAMTMAVAGVNNNVGGDTLNSALAAVNKAAAYVPQTVKAPSAKAVSYGGAVIDPVTQMIAERLGLATQADAATVDRGSVRDATAEQGLKYMQGYLNPYEDQVVQATLADLDRSRRLALIGQEDAALGSGAYGGSRHGVADSLTNEAALRQAALTSGQLRQAGFDTAAGLGMTDATRALQAMMANQGVDLSAMNTNAGFQQQANLTNAAAQNQYGLANAEFGNQANQFNANAANTRSLSQAQLQQQAGIASMQAANEAALANAQMALSAGVANQSAGLAGANLGLSAGNALSTLSDQQRAQYFGNAGILETVGGTKQGQTQRELDSDYGQWLLAQGYPAQQLATLQSGVPTTNLGTTTTQSPSPAAVVGQILSSAGALTPELRRLLNLP